MKKLIALVLGISAAVALISCGGSGSTPLSPAGQQVQNMQRFSLLSMANSGLGFSGFGGFGGGGGTTGGGGGGGIPSIGGFIRNFGSGGLLPGLMHRLEAGTTGGTGGSTGGEDFYFDEWLQLWVDSQWTETTYTSTFYLDQAKAQPAGHITSTSTGTWNTYPQTFTSDYSFEGGTLAGSHGAYNCTFTSEADGAMTYDNTYADTSHDSGTASWTAAGSTWNSRWDGPNGVGWYQDHGDWTSNGSGDYACSNSDGWASTWHYNANGSGNAHFEGPDPKLPAEMTWTANGHYRITYADGSHEEWSWDDLWSGDGEGTSGSTGGVLPPLKP